MKLRILGSGGCTGLPRPCCFCKVCTEAREKGEPYKRSSCSLFIEDINYLIDTPEDINYILNNQGISQVNGILYSHWDPDHTLGIRVIEQLRLSWYKHFNGEECTNPISVVGLPAVIKDIFAIKNKFGSYLDYYKAMKLCTVLETSSIKVNDLTITLVPIETDITSTAFIFEDSSKKIIYAPCDNKPYPKDERLYNADIAILGGYIPTDGFKGGTILPLDNKIFNAMYTLEEILELKREYNYKKVILTHLEEDWGKSFDDYKVLEETLKNENIVFAYDGMVIE